MSQSWCSFARVSGLLSILALAAGSWGGDAKTFQGEITDSQCALNVHSVSRSHKEMMAMKPEINSRSECARYCVKERGGKFVLITKDKVYKLDSQALAEPWIGAKVRVVATLDPRTDLLRVEAITPLAATSPRAN